MTEYEKIIRRTIGAVLANAGNYPEGVQTRILGKDTAPLADRVSDAVLLALRERGILPYTPVLTTLTKNWDSPLIPGRSGW